jgi:hypothetical protein
MAEAVAIRASSLPLLSFNNVQSLTHKNDEIEEPRHNNQLETYNNDPITQSTNQLLRKLKLLSNI